MMALLQTLTVPHPSTLDPRGPAAAREAALWWGMLAVAAVVFLLVLYLLLRPLLRRPVDGDVTPGEAMPHDVQRRWLVWAGAVMPAAVLFAVFIATLLTLAAVRMPPRAGDLTIEVIGHRWWWEVRYPGRGVVTADELHIPVGRPVRIRLSSDDVIHSFWVPQLAGKTDLIPGQSNDTWIQATQAGTYYGKCGEYCGRQHAHMAFAVVAQAPGEFDRWLTREASGAQAAGDSGAVVGQKVFRDRGCAFCHAVRGTPYHGEVGPDLTHVASRRLLAGGSFDNTRGMLAGWIANPDVMKPGTLMPAVEMPGDELQALVDYLQTLR
jgi:cytochrome c oxidase subunit 2